ncbi:MAG: type VII toxin-antitoxin system MntA family adenylyltransferase antitoxin [Thermodesulfovibrionales bacterium]
MLRRVIDRIHQVLEKNKFIIFAYLFGSRAKGLEGWGSDWDIAVYFDTKALKYWSRFRLEAEIEKEIKETVQVTVLNTIEDPVFAFEIISSGILLVERDPEVRTLFEADVLRRYHDWSYYLKRHEIKPASSAT